jgi:hypothetical protein
VSCLDPCVTKLTLKLCERLSRMVGTCDGGWDVDYFVCKRAKWLLVLRKDRWQGRREMEVHGQEVGWLHRWNSRLLGYRVFLIFKVETSFKL